MGIASPKLMLECWIWIVFLFSPENFSKPCRQSDLRTPLRGDGGGDILPGL